jgi:hypothetical protein
MSALLTSAGLGLRVSRASVVAPLGVSVAHMSTLPLRARITGKKGNQQFYKGKGAVKGGRHTKHGGYVMDPAKLKFWEVPDLTGFELTPYVPRTVPKPGKVGRKRAMRRAKYMAIHGNNASEEPAQIEG